MFVCLFFFQASANAAATPCVPTTCWLIPRGHPSRSVGSLSCQQTIKQRIIYQAPVKVNKQIPRWVAAVWERSDGVTSGSLQKQWSLRFPDQTPADATLVWQRSEHSRAAGSSTETQPSGLLRSTASQNFHVQKARDAVPSYVASDGKKEKLTKMKDYASLPPPVQHRPSFEHTGTTCASSWILSFSNHLTSCNGSRCINQQRLFITQRKSSLVGLSRIKQRHATCRRSCRMSQIADTNVSRQANLPKTNIADAVIWTTVDVYTELPWSQN